MSTNGGKWASSYKVLFLSSWPSPIHSFRPIHTAGGQRLLSVVRLQVRMLKPWGWTITSLLESFDMIRIQNCGSVYQAHLDWRTNFVALWIPLSEALMFSVSPISKLTRSARCTGRNTACVIGCERVGPHVRVHAYVMSVLALNSKGLASG